MTTENKLNKYIGEKIKERRTKLGMSQRELGGYIKVSAQQLAKYEKNKNRISASSLYKVSKSLGVSMLYFYKEKDDK